MGTKSHRISRSVDLETGRPDTTESWFSLRYSLLFAVRSVKGEKVYRLLRSTSTDHWKKIISMTIFLRPRRIRFKFNTPPCRWFFYPLSTVDRYFGTRTRRAILKWKRIIRLTIFFPVHSKFFSPSSVLSKYISIKNFHFLFFINSRIFYCESTILV